MVPLILCALLWLLIITIHDPLVIDDLSQVVTLATN